MDYLPMQLFDLSASWIVVKGKVSYSKYKTKTSVIESKKNGTEENVNNPDDWDKRIFIDKEEHSCVWFSILKNPFMCLVPPRTPTESLIWT